MEVQEDDVRDFSDEEEGRIRSVSKSAVKFPDSVVSNELGAIEEMLQAIPEALNIDLRDHKVSARYKERHFESLSKRIEVVCMKVKSLRENCKLMCVLHESVHKALEQSGIESKQEWEEYLSTIERDGELLAEVCSILDTDMLQVVKVVRQVKQKADAHENDRMDDGRVPVNSRSEEGTDWSVLRARLETMCSDVIGRTKRGCRSAD
ncbi:hypothetical protein Y032_0003g1696 [Ancylostoma ceylanicum]|uniref:Uncharacterized protein n=1 Tax=Ancylostoma ceylanicum TaxID=53326 RepID=A0A016VYG2_9BILA|nr:hypothetical protein Y032_0003g1696 [Ancylostoma ceylanicum]